MTTIPPPDRPQPSFAQIQILATSDLHMNLTGYDYYSDQPDPHVGLARIATLIRTARREARQSGALSLLFDNGDSLQGTPFGDWAAENSVQDHPLARAFNALEYDAVGLGNHDFNFGLDLIDHFAEQLTCPLLSSNLSRKDGKRNPKPFAILQRDIQWNGTSVPIQVGVLSVLPPQTAKWEAHCLNGMADFHDILETAQDTAARLRQYGCDIVVALAHSGLAEPQAQPGLENAVIPLAAINEIDAIIAGHTHLTLPGKVHTDIDHVDSTLGLVHDTPTAMPGFAGSHLAVIDLMLERDEIGQWSVARSRTGLRPVFPSDRPGPVAEDPELLKLFSQGHAATRTCAARPVGWLSRSIHSYFSFCAPDRGLALLAAAQAAGIRPFLAGTEWATLPILSAAAPPKSGGRAGPAFYTHVAAGEISMRHVADIHLFPNELRAILVTGAQVRDWLEMAAGLYNQITPEHDKPLTNPRVAGYNFDVLHGLSYQIDLSQPQRFDANGAVAEDAGTRIRKLTHNGRSVPDDQVFVVAVNNYRANGGGNFPGLEQARKISLPPLRIQDVLRDYLTGKLARDPLEDSAPPFNLAPMNGARAVLETGAGAEAFLDELTSYAPRILGRDAAGFLRIELTL